MQKRTNTAKWNGTRWRIDVQKDGVRKSFYSSIKGRNGQREANKKADEWLDDNLINQNIKVSKLYIEYIKEKELNVGTSRYKNIQSIFNKWIINNIGNINVSNLTEQNLQDILNKQYKKGLSYKRIQETKIVLCDFMKFARKNNITKLIPENLEVNKRAYKGERTALQPTDIQKLFTSNKTTKFGVEVEDKFINIYRFITLTGLRRGEMLGLKWSDIQNNKIYIKRSVNEYREITEGKTANAKRTIPLTPIVKNLLSTIPKKSKYVFNDNKLSIRPNYITESFKKYAEYNHLSATKLHELRHTFISLTDSDLPLNTLKDIVGHSKTMNTVKTYGHTLDGEMEKANQIINNKFTEILESKFN